MMLTLTLTLLSLCSILTFAEKVQVDVGDEICVAGYIMDHYCINRGTLLDRSSIVTLSSVGPSSHSLHCLVDVGVCRRSSFEILKQMEDGSFGRAWRLDDNSLVLSHARDIGRCDTCKNGGGSQTHGYQSTIFGKVMDLGSNSTPAMIEVTDVQDYEVGCGGIEYEPPSMVMGSGGSGMFKLTFAQKITLHASLMLFGWGLLLPSGVVIARFSKHRKDAFWYKVHRTIQPIGIILTFIAWIIALLNFSALGNTTMPIFNVHGVCGMITMCIGIFQPINAILRPHVPSGDEEKSEIRVFWEYLHKGLGYLATFVLAPITIVLGTYIVPTPDESQRFQILHGVSAILVIGIAIFFILENKKLTRNK